MVAQIDREYMQHGWGRTLRRLASYALFEGRPLTTRGRWINPFVFGGLRLLAALPGKPHLTSPIFITGLGRSGTTILGLLLSLHRDVGFLNEPKAVWHVIDPRQDINGNYSHSGGRFRFDVSDVVPRARLRAHRAFGRYLALVGARRLVDKYPELIFRVDYLLGLFPDARIVFISRNGIDATQSINTWSKQHGAARAGHTEDWWGRDDIKWRYLCDQLLRADKRYATIRSFARPDLDNLHRAAIEWIVTTREGLLQSERHPEAVVHIAYEDLVVRPEQELNRLQEACGLAPDPVVTTYALQILRQNPPRSYPALDEPVRLLFEETMSRLGFNSGAPKPLQGAG